MIQSPDLTTTYTKPLLSYVEDVNINRIFAAPNNQSDQHITNDVMAIYTTLNHLLQITGGKLAPNKCIISYANCSLLDTLQTKTKPR